jgi:hypothetical protein
MPAHEAHLPFFQGASSLHLLREPAVDIATARKPTQDAFISFQHSPTVRRYRSDKRANIFVCNQCHCSVCVCGAAMPLEQYPLPLQRLLQYPKHYISDLVKCLHSIGFKAEQQIVLSWQFQALYVSLRKFPAWAGHVHDGNKFMDTRDLSQAQEVK